MNRLSKVLVSSAAIAALGIGAAFAATSHKTPEEKADRIMKRLDANKDGAVSRDEIAAKAMERFAKGDLNKDGRITKDEIDATMPKAKPEKRAKLFRRYDANGDGAITQAEVEAKIQKRMAKMDSDKDGKITRAEYIAFRAAKAAKKHG
ncbi:EF-hand domain-containing protein [Prosthecomicrobium sp. N25]|uniref:EF-hand domain-containing protein n=1 Tax=Prosthecomicrobium sp. N25 TaxID=3129254 RepID=UPI0030773BF6